MSRDLDSIFLINEMCNRADPTPGRHTVTSAPAYNISRIWEHVSWAPAVRMYPKDEEYLPTDREALKTIAGMALKQVIDGSGCCIYGAMTGPDNYRIFDYLNAVTGWKRTADEYMDEGKRIQTVRHLFNIKHGVDLRMG